MNQSGAMIFALVVVGIFFAAIAYIGITSYINEKKEEKKKSKKENS